MGRPFSNFSSLLLIIVLLLFGFSNLRAQSITPFTLNNGGGFASSLEWSISESISIEHFSGPTSQLNTGVLQPLTYVVTNIVEYGPLVFGNTITMGPNPTSNKLFIKGDFSQLGSITIQLVDSKSAIVKIIEGNESSLRRFYEKEIDMELFPAGIYYVRIFFKPIVGVLKTGIYKIVKI